ncbi:hypothetical protein GLOIN_2v1761399 [Rhizophagus clarus]|uniref:Uncharacterized protein n=1 Tax=Rhizophagus clarus TaxID=94130 RepID=A0A8H3KRV4_9GLOM|nr:hypothetical protein GLOIN_2v1761399 [Rhizophagus clarus]
MGQDTIPRIHQDGQLIALPPGRRAHEIPDKIFEWHRFFQNLTKLGIKSALESFQKWFSQWLHLPLTICRLGWDNTQSFASSFYHVFLEKPGFFHLLNWNCSLLSIWKMTKITNSLKPKLYLFLNLYDLLKAKSIKIYYIDIHQQQVEGHFNKLDLKTHANMTFEMKQLKLLLSSNISKENLDNLKEVRKQIDESRRPLQEIQPQPFGPDIASALFKQMLC